jgi:hypothetical protein
MAGPKKPDPIKTAELLAESHANMVVFNLLFDLANSAAIKGASAQDTASKICGLCIGERTAQFKMRERAERMLESLKS